MAWQLSELLLLSVPELSIASKPESEAVRVNVLNLIFSKNKKLKNSRVLAVERMFYDLSPKDISAQSYLQGSVYAL